MIQQPSRESQPVYFAIEGIDGSGKSTLRVALVNLLAERYGQGSIVVWHYNNQDNVFGRLMRQVFETPNHRWEWLVRPRWVREAMYAFSARANLRRIPISAARIVLSNRSVVTAYALHQGKLPTWYVTLVEPWRYPDVVLFLDLDAAEAVRRIGDRGPAGRGENFAKLAELRQRYETVLGADRPPRLHATEIIRIDASAPPSAVTERAFEQLQSWLSDHRPDLTVEL